MAREINLVPDIKNDMIKALKLRNFIFFLSIVIASASVGVTIVVGTIAGGQQIAVTSRESTIKALSNKLNSYGDLSEFLTIRNQVSSIDSLTSNKKVFSRTFNILTAMLPTGADTITISELNVDLSGEIPIYALEAQANAGQEPFIDYNVLEAFKKSMGYIRYDYGRYVDKNDNEIPAYCMIETNPDGSVLNDPEKGLYAYWAIRADGCAPVSESDSSDEDSDSEAANSSTTQTDLGYSTETFDGQEVVRIWRTPQYSEWYKETEVEGQPYMDLDGNISNVPHFVSSCISFTGEVSSEGATPKWTESNQECKIVPDDENGIVIDESSNGRDDNNELVLRFSASIALAPEIYDFNNAHMLAFAPSGRRNVTDSYMQIQAMFGERAADCEPGDAACSDTSASSPSTNNSNNNGGNQNG